MKSIVLFVLLGQTLKRPIVSCLLQVTSDINPAGLDITVLDELHFRGAETTLDLLKDFISHHSKQRLSSVRSETWDQKSIVRERLRMALSALKYFLGSLLMVKRHEDEAKHSFSQPARIRAEHSLSLCPVGVSDEAECC
jgi:hypothetical protein